MHGYLLPILAVAFTAIAFPSRMMEKDFMTSLPRDVIEKLANIPRQSLPTTRILSENEGNSGPFPSLQFNEQDQFVDVRPGTAHEFRPPGPKDLRGPCPGLNAAANHGFLPRNGKATISQTVTGLSQAYSFGADFAAPLAVVAIALTGDPLTGQWSIGQGFKPVINLGQTPAEGISFSHSQYESDASIVREDAFLNNGDASSVIIERFDALYSRTNNFTLDVMRDFNQYVYDLSVSRNPYFYLAPFAGLVPPIAHHFVINLMSNHSAENIQGYFNRDMLKTFFAVSGPDNAHVWNYGQEQIPQNWYKRPSNNPYGVAAAVADVSILATKYPQVISFGGNTGTVNSFVGVDPGDITGGVFNAHTLFQGNNLGCFLFSAAQQAIPILLKDLINGLAGVLTGCPKLNIDTSAFSQFPGASYHPKQPGF